jgi:hypothetical protein
VFNQEPPMASRREVMKHNRDFRNSNGSLHMMNKVDIMSKKLDDLGTKYKGLNFIKNNESSDSLFASKKILNSAIKSPQANTGPVKVDSNTKT